MTEDIDLNTFYILEPDHPTAIMFRKMHERRGKLVRALIERDKLRRQEPSIEKMIRLCPPVEDVAAIISLAVEPYQLPGPRRKRGKGNKYHGR